MITARAVLLGALASFFCTAWATASPADQALRVALEKRQNNDDDRSDYDCHASCGYTIVDAGDQGTSYCSNQTWVTQLNDCLACADDADLWEYYGNGVNGVARQCGYTALSPGESVSATYATASAPASASATSGASNSAPAAVTNCHTHDDTPYCVADGDDWEIETDVDETNLPDGYESCRPNGDDEDDITCVADGGAEIVLHREGDDHTDDDTSSSVTTTSTATVPAATTGPTAGGAASAASSQASESAAAAANTNAATVVGAAPVSLFGLMMAVFAIQMGNSRWPKVITRSEL